MKIYKLDSNTIDYSFFMYNHNKNDKEQYSISRESRNWHWKSPILYDTVLFELRAGDNKKKNYNFDISTFETPFIIISEKTWLELKDILEPRGILFEINTPSKRKKFYGYYPTNVIYPSALNRKYSEYTEYPNGLLIYKYVLDEDKIKDDYLFVVEESISDIFVTEKFKERVEKAGLLGFDFSEEVKIINEKDGK